MQFYCLFSECKIKAVFLQLSCKDDFLQAGSLRSRSKQQEFLFEAHIETEKEVGLAEVEVVEGVDLKAEVQSFEFVFGRKGECKYVANVGSVGKAWRCRDVQGTVGVGRPEKRTAEGTEIVVAVPEASNGVEGELRQVVLVPVEPFVGKGGVEGLAAVVEGVVLEVIVVERGVEFEGVERWSESV